MKKIIIPILFLLGAVLFNDVSANADVGSDIIVKTESISAQVDQYAKDDFGLALTSMLFLENNNTNSSNYILGSAFSMFDGEDTEDGTVYYPVYLSGKIEFLYSVRKNEVGGYSSSVSRFLVNEINRAIDSSDGSSISFFVKEDDIFYVIDNTITKIFEAPVDEFSSNESGSTDLKIEEVNETLQSIEGNLEEKNILDKTDYNEQSNISKSPNMRSSVSTAKNYAMIDWRINETQGVGPLHGVLDMLLQLF